MRKIIVGAQVSMDGVMQAPGLPTEDPTKGFKFGGWVMPYFDQEFGEELDRLFSEKFDLLLGRKDLRDFRGVLAVLRRRRSPWRLREALQGDQEVRGFAPGGVDTSWQGSVLLRDIADVKRLREEDGPCHPR